MVWGQNPNVNRRQQSICTVVGARPQFIKAAAVSAVLRRSQQFREVVVHTGQHFDRNMSDVFFEQLEMAKPDYALGIGGGSHAEQTSRMLLGLEEVMVREKPDWVLIYGDTNSTLAGALVAAKLHIPIAHVEAGLRSFNRRMPEEVNRVVADHLSSILFAPTDLAVRQLKTEGIANHVHMVGDVMYDVARMVFENRSPEIPPVLQDLAGRDYALATIHRAENTDDQARLRAIFEGLAGLARTLAVVVPLHPRTRKALASLGLLDWVEKKLVVLEPVGYAEMLALEAGAELIVTDSGGVQKEAYFRRVPCVTLRDETEWVELIETGWNRLCPPASASDIARVCQAAIGTKGQDVALYGGGHASQLIVEHLAGSR